MGTPRITQVFGAVNIGSFRISAMIMGVSETGEMVVLGSGHRAAQGIKRGYVTDMAAATHAIRDCVERAEKSANTSISSVWIGCSGAGLVSQLGGSLGRQWRTDHQIHARDSGDSCCLTSVLTETKQTLPFLVFLQFLSQ